MTSLATGASQPISRAPAVASVITASEIEAIGALDLDDVLETVPGLHVSRSVRGYNPIYTIRGIYSETNPQVLVLMNGIPITNLYIGDRGQIWGGMPVKNISRIEIIRGPGSALHGADAFAGTINIVTKSAREINGTQLGAFVGSADTKGAWLLHGQRNNGLDVAFSFQYSSINGQGGIIDSDAQTGLDLSEGTSASNAPGPVNTQRETFDARLDLKHTNWQLRFGYQGRQDGGTGAGVAQALDPNGTNDSERFNADLTYSNEDSFNNWDVTAQLSYLDTSAKSDLFLFPAGASFPNGQTFTNGVIGNPDVFEHHARLGGSAFYHGFTDHRVRIGTGVNFSEIDKIRESKNFLLDDMLLPTLINDDGRVIDTSNNPDLVFHQPGSRTNFYGFVQDEWNFSTDWALTTGIRWDHYSDFGPTINPRTALVWQSSYNFTTKLLYGRAFRAPSFAELRNINNPVFLGNPNLNPEIIDTVELVFDYRPTQDIATTLNIFRHELRDIIRLVPDSGIFTAQNTGDQRGYGLEWEIDWRVNSKHNLLANYAFQNSTDEETNSDVANAPQNQIYVRSNWQFSPSWWLNTQARIQAISAIIYIKGTKE